ncbi:MAG: DNA cytosine methyltransferase [Verrucomicrobiota bacterium]
MKNALDNLIDVDLFAGAGGLAVGLRAAGFSPASFYELDVRSCQTLRHNLEGTHSTLFGTVYEGKAEEVDWNPLSDKVRLLAAGAPCQPFSLGGKHQADRDGRNLFPQVFRAVRELRPMAIFLENVRGLARESFRPYFDYILRHLECPSVKPGHHELWQNHDHRIRQLQMSPGYEPEYRVVYRLVEAADFGVPQNRQRVFIVATRRDLPVYEFPHRTHSKAALIAAQKSGEYWEQHGIRRPRSFVLSENGGHDANGSLPWLTVRDALQSLPPPSKLESDSTMNHWAIPGARIYTGHSGSIMDWPAKTIKAGVHGVPGGENTITDDDGAFRYFTLRETARMQTFPDKHLFKGARIHVTRQIGNAVPCLLATNLAQPLFNLIKHHLTVKGKGTK